MNILYDTISFKNIGSIDYISSETLDTNTMQISVTSSSGTARYLKLTNYNGTAIGTSILMSPYTIEVTGKGPMYSSLTVKKQVKFEDGQLVPSYGIYGNLFIDNNIRDTTQADISKNVRIYALKISNNSKINYGIYCYGRSDFIGNIYIKYKNDSVSYDNLLEKPNIKISYKKEPAQEKYYLEVGDFTNNRDSSSSWSSTNPDENNLFLNFHTATIGCDDENNKKSSLLVTKGQVRFDTTISTNTVNNTTIKTLDDIYIYDHVNNKHYSIKIDENGFLKAIQL